jgi:hypothetical protein
MAADQGIIDSVANENTKVVAGGPAGYFSTLPQIHTAHLAALAQIDRGHMMAMNLLQLAITGSVSKSLTELDAIEAMSNAVIGQQGAKVAQTTPPETGKKD